MFVICEVLLESVLVMHHLCCVGVSDWQASSRDPHQLSCSAALQVSYPSEMSGGGRQYTLITSADYTLDFCYFCASVTYLLCWDFDIKVIYCEY